VIADGHDEQGTTFVSIEKNVSDAAAYLRARGIQHLDCLYGVSMGGASVIRFLATEDIAVDKAIIDAGITPYPYPRWICRIIAKKDLATMSFACRNRGVMEAAMPPERWTPEGEDPTEHYDRVWAFLQDHMTDTTIYNVFWSANNYAMPDPMPELDTEMEYWYGENEKKARRANIAYAQKAFPGITLREFPDLEHGELVMMFPDRFHQELLRFEKE
jgi:pimeloyl-ACP methyl ester carboxylesterase